MLTDNKELKALFESSVFNDETKTVLQVAFQEAIEENTKKIQEQFDTKLVEEKAAYIDSMKATLEEAISEEIESIAEELKAARTLEVRYAEKLQTFKEAYAEKQEEMTKALVEEAVAEEFEELKADIETAKKHEFVMKVYESFADVYKRMFGGTEVDLHDKLEEAQKELSTLKHEKRVNELLEGFTGKKRRVASIVLESVAYENLDKKFAGIKDILLSESSEEDANDDGKGTLRESKDIIQGDKNKGIVVLDESAKSAKKESPPVKDAVAQRLEKSLRFAGVAK